MSTSPHDRAIPIPTNETQNGGVNNAELPESVVTRMMNGKNPSRMMDPSLQQLTKTTIEKLTKNQGCNLSLFVFPTRKCPSQVICLSRGGTNISLYSLTREDPVTAIVVSKAGGIHKNCLNIEYSSPETLVGQRGPFDFENVSHWETVENTESVRITGVTDVTGDEYAEAKREELPSWQTNQVFHAVDNVGQTAIGTR